MFCLYFILSLCVVTCCQDASANQEQNKHAPSADTDLCTAVKYENKCFIPVGRFVTYDALVAKCKSLGGQVANIYSQTHINVIAKYVTKKAMRSNYWQMFNLGMKYDPKAKKLTFRDGSDATAGLLWQPGSPYTVEGGAQYATYTNVVLFMLIPASSAHQHIVNYPPYWMFDGLCEIE